MQNISDFFNRWGRWKKASMWMATRERTRSSQDWGDVEECRRGKDEVCTFRFLFEYYPMSRRAGRLLDVARDGYYDSAKCIEDFEKVYWIFLVKNNNAPCKNQAMDFVEIAFGGKYKPIFLLDHSPIHKYGLESFFAWIQMKTLQGNGWGRIERQDHER